MAKAKPSKKAVEAKKSKAVEDKTFGLKNKSKSKKVQQYVNMVTSQAKNGGELAREKMKREEEKAKKEMKKMAELELASMMKEVLVQPKLAFGQDPKSVLCVHFKAGSCTKGDKCKYSHDMKVASKSAKRSANVDLRDEEKVDGDKAGDEEKKDDTMDKWDEEKLRGVVAKKAEAQHHNRPTDIVCKYFLEALDKELYGWFWVCPNGGDECKYRHALPPGFVFKTKRERDAERAAFLEGEGPREKDIFEIIEERRALLPRDGLTPITKESLAKWKEDRRLKEVARIEEQRKAESRRVGGRGSGLTGRALFIYDPSMFEDDPDADGETYEVLDASDMEEGDDEGEHDHEDEEGEDGEEEEVEGGEAEVRVEDVALKVDESLFTGGDDDLDDIDDS